MNDTFKLLILFTAGPAIGLGIVFFGIVFPIVMLCVFFYFAIRPTKKEIQ
jgi:preprotein translocase subunit YajC